MHIIWFAYALTGIAGPFHVYLFVRYLTAHGQTYVGCFDVVLGVFLQ